jgi:DNA-binding transcriptional MocR family regulator
MNNSTAIGAGRDRLFQRLRAEIARRPAGDRLPSTRALCEQYGASPVTVSRVLAALVAEGLVVTRPGAGTFVATPVVRRGPTDHSWQTLTLGLRTFDPAGMTPLLGPEPDAGTISLATGYLHPSLMPVKALGGALARAARLPDAWDRPPPAGIHGLRAWFAGAAGGDTEAADVVVTPGGQGALTTAVRAIVGTGEPLLVESPTYPGVLAVARAAGISPVPVPTDGEGVVPELLADAFARTGARALYCQPTFANPTGSVLGPERRRAVLDVASAANAFIVEDDFARWLGHDRRAPGTLLADDHAGRVVYVTSLTKVASPSLRIGAVISRGPVAARLQATRIVDDMFVARPMQEAALDLVSRTTWERHLRHLSTTLDDRSGRLRRSVATHLPAVDPGPRPTGGMHLWVRLPEGVDDVAVAARAARHGVLVTPGRSFFPAEPPAPYLRLTFAAAASEADLELGVKRLADAVPELVTGRRSAAAGPPF